MGGAIAPIPAHTEDLVSGPRPMWHKQHRRAIAFCAVFFAGAFLYGYDGVYMASLLGMDKFRFDFGDRLPNGTYEISATNQSLFSSIIQAGEFVGSLAAAFIGDFLGRRGSLQTAVVIASVGAILQLLVVGSVPLLVVGRLVLGMGIGVVSNCVPLYLSEIPHASIRGSVVAGWQLLLAIGQVIGACIGQGTKDYTNTFSWRFPIAFILVITLLIFGFSFTVPESPRWLSSKHRDNKALKALKRIHKNADYPEQEVETEMQILIEARKAEENNEGDSAKWSDLVLKKADRRRFICAFGVLCFQQLSGVQFIFSYATVFFQSIGIDKSFEMTIVVDILEVLGVVCSLFIVNRFGRRPLLIWTGIFMTATDIVIGAIGTKRDRSTMENQAIVAMIMLYVFFFNLAWGPLAWACATELSAGKNKTRIMALGTAGFWICCWAVTFTLPYLYNPEKANLGPMTCFIYAGGGVLSVIFVYFLIPETLGRSLEEIQVMMDLDVPTRAWGNYRVGTVQGEFGQDHFRQNVKRTRSGLHVEHKDDAAEEETADAINRKVKKYDAADV